MEAAPSLPLAAVASHEHLPRQVPLMVKEAVALADVHAASVLQEEPWGAAATCKAKRGQGGAESGWGQTTAARTWQEPPHTPTQASGTHLRPAPLMTGM